MASGVAESRRCGLANGLFQMASERVSRPTFIDRLNPQLIIMKWQMRPVIFNPADICACVCALSSMVELHVRSVIERESNGFPLRQIARVCTWIANEITVIMSYDMIVHQMQSDRRTGCRPINAPNFIRRLERELIGMREQ